MSNYSDIASQKALLRLKAELERNELMQQTMGLMSTETGSGSSFALTTLGELISSRLSLALALAGPAVSYLKTHKRLATWGLLLVAGGLIGFFKVNKRRS